MWASESSLVLVGYRVVKRYLAAYTKSAESTCYITLHNPDLICLLCLQVRDMTLGYVCVTVTYLFIGIMFYCSFPIMKSCIEDVCILSCCVITEVYSMLCCVSQNFP